MKVTVAKSAGFCFGVKRAVEQVYQQLETGKKPVYTYGPIIHNDQVVKELEQKGVRVIRSEEELERLGEGTVIIRSHGVSRRVQEKMEASGLTVADATCPFVKKSTGSWRRPAKKDSSSLSPETGTIRKSRES